MNSNQLAQFIAIAEEESVTQAGKRLFMTQSALSNTLKQLENELECKLFNRESNQFILNENGKKLLLYARQVEEILEAAKSNIKTGVVLQNIQALCFASVYFSLFGRYFAGTNSCFRVSMKLLEPDTLIESLWKCNNCIAIAPDSLFSKYNTFDLERLFLMTEQLMVSFPPEHPLSQRASITLQELDGETFAVTAGHDYSWEKALLKENKININFADVSLNIMSRIKARDLPFPTFSRSSFYQLTDFRINPVIRPVVPVDGENTTRDICVWYAKRYADKIVPFIDDMQSNSPWEGFR